MLQARLLGFLQSLPGILSLVYQCLLSILGQTAGRIAVPSGPTSRRMVQFVNLVLTGYPVQKSFTFFTFFIFCSTMTVQYKMRLPG